MAEKLTATAIRLLVVVPLDSDSGSREASWRSGRATGQDLKF